MCEVMGIVNVTPDSFSDGGKYFTPEEAIRRAFNLSEEGASIIDLGGESTRPGATPLDWHEEWRRIEPVLTSLVGKLHAKISIDTYHPETAEKALACGAHMINCVYIEPARDIAKMCFASEREVVIPVRAREFIQDSSCYSSLVYIDPMIGFGTTREEDISLLRSIPDFVKLGHVLVGASRKRIVKKLTGEKMVGRNLGGNLGVAVWAAMNGASAVRVHDVRETVQALRVVDVLKG